jgi:hypothetical protein
LEEIAVENARVFKRYGGENFAAIPCLNDAARTMTRQSMRTMIHFLHKKRHKKRAGPVNIPWNGAILRLGTETRGQFAKRR